jgi:hypothetical protein
MNSSRHNLKATSPKKKKVGLNIYRANTTKEIGIDLFVSTEYLLD